MDRDQVCEECTYALALTDLDPRDTPHVWCCQRDLYTATRHSCDAWRARAIYPAAGPEPAMPEQQYLRLSVTGTRALDELHVPIPKGMRVWAILFRAQGILDWPWPFDAKEVTVEGHPEMRIVLVPEEEERRREAGSEPTPACPHCARVEAACVVRDKILEGPRRGDEDAHWKAGIESTIRDVRDALAPLPQAEVEPAKSETAMPVFAVELFKRDTYFVEAASQEAICRVLRRMDKDGLEELLGNVEYTVQVQPEGGRQADHWPSSDGTFLSAFPPEEEVAP